MIEANAFLKHELRGGEHSHLPRLIEMVQRMAVDPLDADQIRANFSAAFVSKEDLEHYLAAMDRFVPLPVETYHMLVSSADWKLSFSPIGRGVSAIRAFETGACVAAGTGVATIDSALMLEARAAEVERGDQPLGIVLNDAIQISSESYLIASGITGLLNHSCDPNVAFVADGEGFAFRALRPIRPFEPLTYDYASIISDCFLLECACQASSCRGIASRTFVLSDEARAAFLRRYPEGWLLDFIAYEAQYAYDPDLHPTAWYCQFFEGTDLGALLRDNPHFDPAFKKQILEHLRSELH